MSRLPFLDECRHFNGIKNRTCRAGVAYDGLRSAGRLPCLQLSANSGPLSDTCSSRELMTQEEHEARAAEVDAAVKRAVESISRGECHVCGKPIEPSTVVGRCRYASCGHRVGQVAR